MNFMEYIKLAVNKWQWAFILFANCQLKAFLNFFVLENEYPYISKKIGLTKYYLMDLFVYL